MAVVLPGGDPAGPVLAVEGLNVEFHTEAGVLHVVRDASLEVGAGETVALVGESGCGKSVTALAVMGLIDPPGRISSGDIRLRGRSLVGLAERAWQALRGDRIGMIFQEPMTSLNPVFTIGEQIGEVLARHRPALPPAERRERVVALLERVGIPMPARRAGQYPHELSGGMKQRVMIAMALACEPDLLIADEPTTALDVTIQAQILDLLQALQEDMGMAILLITHNLGVVAHAARRVLVMYGGEIVEEADTRALFKSPRHPYTEALLGAIPVPGHRGERLVAIEGSVPPPQAFPAGCRFSSRCPHRLDRCPAERPPVVEVDAGHRVACWLHVEGGS